MLVALFYFCCEKAALEVPKKVCLSVRIHQRQSEQNTLSQSLWLRYFISAVSVILSCAEAALEGLEKYLHLSVHMSVYRTDKVNRILSQSLGAEIFYLSCLRLWRLRVTHS